MTIKKCYIADFGIARVLMNQHDSIEGKIGSQGFRAPELLKGIPYGQSVDVWGFGCLLYGILFVKLPFSDEKMVVNDEAFDIWQQPDVQNMYGDEVMDLINSILVKNPAKRPTMEQILAHPWFDRLR